MYFFARNYAVKFSKVHCSYISLGQSLQREGHVDNFLIPLFCRKLFEDCHPSKSGRHHFFSFIGASIIFFLIPSTITFLAFLFIILCFIFIFLSFFWRKNILDYKNNVQLEVISKALLGAASASRGKRLELSDYVVIFQIQFFCLSSELSTFIFFILVLLCAALLPYLSE